MDNKEESKNITEEEKRKKSESIVELNNTRNQVVFKIYSDSDQFYKHITTIMTGLLALLVGLTPLKSLEYPADKWFLATIILIVICIFSCTLSILGHIEFQKKYARILHRQLKISLGVSKRNGMFRGAQKEKWHSWREVIALVSLFSTFLSLIIYVKKLM